MNNLLRLVKMEFQEGKAEIFRETYAKYSARIAAAEGCRSVRLMNDHSNGNIFFTVSEWESEKNLDDYRKSDLFKEVWSQVKPMFAVPAQAWTLKD
ncbi:MAG TPA: antibiotic biosynthesis monooxygenase family protein [Bacteroidia bacterium]|jgi:quinol monooxygenase YgiN|nr:antibiotic biosynthesis monooxygenase family protein [Bacteroidia bacterium]